MSHPQETTLSAFFGWERQTPDHVFLRQYLGDTVRTWTYRQAAEEVRRMATALQSLKMAPASPVALVSSNSAHSVLADLAIMTAGYVTVPLSPGLSSSEITTLLSDSGSRAFFVGAGLSFAPETGLQVIALPGAKVAGGLAWDECMRNYEPLRPVTLPARDAIASIVYNTRGRGAAFSHGATGFAAENVKAGLRLRTPAVFWSALPLHTAAGRLYGALAPVSSGSTIAFGDASETTMDTLRRERPDLVVADADTLGMMRDVLLKSYSERRLKRLTATPGVEIFIKAHIRKKLGLQHATTILCANAPAPAGLARWFAPLGLDVREMWSVTESGGYAHGNFRLIRHDTVGQPWPWVEVRIDKSGEILLRHRGLMKGYHNNPAATKEVLTPDGFLRTGYRGKADAQGYLTIAPTTSASPSLSQLQIAQN